MEDYRLEILLERNKIRKGQKILIMKIWKEKGFFIFRFIN